MHIVAMIFQAITKHTEVSTLKELVLKVWIILLVSVVSYPIIRCEVEYVELAMSGIIMDCRQDAVVTDLCLSFLQRVVC